MNISRTILASGLALVAGVASAQTLYSPNRTVKDQGIVLKSWGSGTVAETDELAFEGTSSIRISSRNYFQGGIINFASPVNLSDATRDKSNLLYITLQVPGIGKAMSGGSGGGPGSGVAGATGSGDGGQGRGGDGGGATGSRGGGSTGAGTASSGTLKKVRVIISTSDGKKSEAYIDVSAARPDNRGWFSTGVPLAGIAGFDRTNKEITSVAIAGDAVATMYVGEIKVLNDPTPIYGEPNVRELNLAIGDERTFIAFGYGGSTALKYTWDFDANDGIAVDAEGQSVTRRFRKPGDYVITLTISDAYGLKKPYSTTIKVRVNP